MFYYWPSYLSSSLVFISCFTLFLMSFYAKLIIVPKHQKLCWAVFGYWFFPFYQYFIFNNKIFVHSNFVERIFRDWNKLNYDHREEHIMFYIHVTPMLMQILTWIAVLLFFINLYKSFGNAPNFLQLQLEACAHEGFVGNSHLQQQYVRQCRKAVSRYEEMYKICTIYELYN